MTSKRESLQMIGLGEMSTLLRLMSTPNRVETVLGAFPEKEELTILAEAIRLKLTMLPDPEATSGDEPSEPVTP